MSYQEKQSQNKPVTMQPTFCGAFHSKNAEITIPAIVDMYNQSMGV